MATETKSTDNGTVFPTNGLHEVADFEIEVYNETVKIIRYKGTNDNLIIPDEICGYPTTSIGKDAFNGCATLELVVIPQTILSIGDRAFYHCTGLKEIILSNNILSIGECCFFCCDSLESITIPASVEDIGDSAFSYCTSLVAVTFLGTPPVRFGNTVFFLAPTNISLFYPSALSEQWAPNGNAYWLSYRIKPIDIDISEKQPEAEPEKPTEIKMNPEQVKPEVSTVNGKNIDVDELLKALAALLKDK